MHKKYRVTLTLAEREELERMLARGKADVRKIKHAQILLKADEADEAESGPAWPDARIAEAFAAGITTVERVRQRFVEEGFASALSPYRGGTRVYERKLDGAQEARLIALACSALYRPRLVRHRLACYAASTAGESWFCRTAAGVWNPCRSMSQVVL